MLSTARCASSRPAASMRAPGGASPPNGADASGDRSPPPRVDEAFLPVLRELPILPAAGGAFVAACLRARDERVPYRGVCVGCAPETTPERIPGEAGSKTRARRFMQCGRGLGGRLGNRIPARETGRVESPCSAALPLRPASPPCFPAPGVARPRARLIEAAPSSRAGQGLREAPPGALARMGRAISEPAAYCGRGARIPGDPAGDPARGPERSLVRIPPCASRLGT